MTYANYHLPNPFSSVLCIPWYYLYPGYCLLTILTMLFHHFLDACVVDTNLKLQYPRYVQDIPLLSPKTTWDDYSEQVTQILANYLHQQFKESPILDTNIAQNIMEYLLARFQKHFRFHRVVDVR